MKLYKHEGGGHYIGSCIVVVAETLKDAERWIRIELDKQGLSNEILSITECPIEEGSIIVNKNGDY